MVKHSISHLGTLLRGNCSSILQICRFYKDNNVTFFMCITSHNYISFILFQCPLDQDAFRYLNAFDTLTNLLNLGLNMQNASYILPNK